MDNSTNNDSSFFNESDLRLSTSMYQWAGFELDNAQPTGQEAEEAKKNHSADSDNNKDVGSSTSEKPLISPRNDGESENNEADEMLKVVREFLLEKTSQFYNDIIDAQGEKFDKTNCSMDRLRERYEKLRRQTANVVDRFHSTGIEEEVNSRLKSIDAALRQLSIMKSPAAATLSLSSSDSGRSSTDELGLGNASPLHQWRQWLESADAKMARLRQKIDWCDREQLEQRLKQQQALQSRIEQDGGHWVTLVQKYIDSWPSSHRRQIVSASIERRWHALWIKSLEWQCRLERQIRALLIGIADSTKDDGETGEPSAKRRRLIVGRTSAVFDEEDDQTSAVIDDVYSDDLCSAASDTIPFSENEYEPLTPRSIATSTQDEEPNSARDGGYSSGSSAVVTRFEVDDGKAKQEMDVVEKLLPIQQSPRGNSPCLERRTRIENSPIKNFYQMTPTTPEDPTPTNTWPSRRGGTKPLPSRLSEDALYVYTQPFVAPPAELTDSLLVNVGDSMSEALDKNGNNGDNNADDLEEILNLFRQGQERDGFDEELDELLLRRRGTVWVPLSHDDHHHNDDDEADDERKEQTTPTPVRVDTPPNTPSLLLPPKLNLPRISSSGSLKRRRRDENRRPVSNSFTSSSPCNESDLANKCIINAARCSESFAGVASTNVDECNAANMSASWPPMTPSSMVEDTNVEQISLLNNTDPRSERKKLRACRLRRSWSYGVQLQNGGGVLRDDLLLRFANNATIDDNGHHSGAESPTRPNTAVSHVDDECGANALGSSSSNTTTGSSSTNQSLGGSGCVLSGGGEMMADHPDDGDDETALVISGVINGSRPMWEWDDYKPPNHNENGPADQPPLDDTMFTAFGDDYCSHLDQSSAPHSPKSMDGSSSRSPFPLQTRLPPLGISYDSESDESCCIVNESLQELRSAHSALSDGETPGVGSMNGKDFIYFLSACEYNINRLESLLGSSVTLNGSKELESSVKDLLQDWRDLALLLTKRILETPPPAKIAARSRSSEEEEMFVHSLQDELRRLAQSLQSIMAQGSVRSPAVAAAAVAIGRDVQGNTYRSLEETQEILDLLKAVRRSLTAEKIRLDCILQEYEGSVNSLSTRCEAIGEEVAQLRLCFEEAYHTCDVQLRELEALRQKWLHWQQTEELCRHIMSKVCSQGDFKNLQSDLAYLEERVTRVETAFSKLATFLPTASQVDTNGPVVSIEEAALAELKERTETLRRDLDVIKTKMTSDGDRPETKKVTRRRKRSYNATTDEKDAIERKTIAIDQEQPRERKRATSLRRLFRYWPVQVCLCVLVCLNVFFFYPSCCDHMNRYWWSFDSKLAYSNGPPPT